MSRLYDRLLAEGARPLRPRDLLTPDELREGRNLAEPSSTESFDVDQLEHLPVIVADEVGEYCRQFPPDTDPGDVLSVIAPPFDRFAAALVMAGLSPRRPSSDEPKYDLAWEHNGRTVVVEVKSLTDENEERQLRIAIGQVVRYRHQLAENSTQPVRAVIACERKPRDQSWLDLCSQYGITLCWPETFEQLVTQAADGSDG